MDRTEACGASNRGSIPLGDKNFSTGQAGQTPAENQIGASAKDLALAGNLASRELRFQRSEASAKNFPGFCCRKQNRFLSRALYER